MLSSQEILNSKKTEFESYLQIAADKLKPKTELTDACRYALLSGGKRLRPILLMLTAELLNTKNNFLDGALAVEMFHSASLIADDLPTMDNDALRRGKPSVHVKFGEAVAIMASYALISEGYSAIYRCTHRLESEGLSEAHLRGLLAVECVAQNAGIHGATGGQFSDIKQGKLDKEEILTIHRQKTASVFEISFVLGWLFGGGDLKKLPQVQGLAQNFGTAYQIIDDIKDLKQDSEREHAINYAKIFGTEAAQSLALELIKQAQECLISLDIHHSSLEKILHDLIKI